MAARVGPAPYLHPPGGRRTGARLTAPGTRAAKDYRDVPRETPRSKRTPFRIAGAVVVVVTTVGLAQLRPAAPTVERGTLWIDTVKQGEMLREVRGNGSLVPEDLRVVSALTAG